jgi:hypothetical protein
MGDNYQSLNMPPGNFTDDEQDILSHVLALLRVGKRDNEP